MPGLVHKQLMTNTKAKWFIDDIAVTKFEHGEWHVRVDVSDRDEREISLEGTGDAGAFCLKNDQLTTRETVEIESMLNNSAIAEALLADAIEVYWDKGGEAS